ncbi:uncharacterized protein LOC115631320 isoform X2 [Scaptodrosophila lebanonensis]|uniref:Uncharacterized protein LOC115631320 isoform X2 n=1 Tax=Drosophila lebanonensis TaxID=7225 RepID=A0A6J2U6E6_DROLE|nr:uncharacterized protein LOC115631320 isoform X2 [Scaptodrosophila lebanonensis]
MHNSSCAWYFPWPLAGQQQKVMALQTPVSDKISGVYPGSALNPLGALQVQSNLHIRPHHQHSQQQPSVIPHQRPHTPTPTPTPSPSVAYNFTPSLLNTHAQLQESATRYAVAAQATQGSLQGYARTHMLHPTMLSPLSLASCMAAAGTTSFGGVLPQQPTYGEPPLKCISVYPQEAQHPQVATSMNINLGILALGNYGAKTNPSTAALPSNRTIISPNDFGKKTLRVPEKRKTEDSDQIKDLKKAKLETKALKAKRPGFTDERYQETSYYIENGLRKVYPYYFTFTTFTKGRWVGEKILDIFAREFRAHPAEEYERCIQTGTLTVNFEKVPVDYRLKHNDLLANIVHRYILAVATGTIQLCSFSLKN